MIKKKHIAILVMLVFALTILSPAAYADSFSDIKGHWAEAQIKTMVEYGIINGYPDGSFKPDGKITRAEFASLIVKSFKLTKAEGKSFDDTSDHWAKDAIGTANAAGIVKGYSDTAFGPDDPITREQMAVMIVKAAKLTVEDAVDDKSFEDNQSISAWAKESVAVAAANQLISGYPDNTFNPQGYASRAEAAVVLYRSLTVTPAKTDTTPSNGGSSSSGGNSSSSTTTTKVSAISISGDAVVGATLTANPTPTAATGTYQWMRADTADGTYTDISGATSNTYTLDAADSGKYIKVKITAIGSYTGTATSVATSQVANGIPAASDFEVANLTQTKGSVSPVTITAKVGKSSGAVTIYYEGTGGTTYTKSTTLPSGAGSYTVTFDVAAAIGWNAATDLAAGTLTIDELVPGTLGGTVSITGTFKFYETLTANTSALTGNTGTLSYQWKSGGTNAGTNQATYTTVAGDIGKTITVEVTSSVETGTITGTAGSTIAKADGPTAPAAPTLVSKTETSVTLTADAHHEFSKDNGSTWQASETFTGLTPSTAYTFVARVKETTTHEASVAGASVSITTEASALPLMGGTVSITGNAKYNETISANIGGVTYTPNTSSDVPTYQWNRAGVSIAGATNSTYTLVADDIGKVITVTITADGTNAVGSVTSSGTSAVAKADGPAAPAVVGSVNDTDNEILVVGGEEKITVTVGTNMNGAYEYSVDSGSNWVDLGVAAGTSGGITGLTSAVTNIQIRIKATTTYEAGAAATQAVTVTSTFASKTVEVDNNKDTLGIVGTNVSSSNLDVATATILSGKIKITSVSAGTATITVKKVAAAATIPVTVETDGSITIGTIVKAEIVVTNIKVYARDGKPLKTTYTAGEALDLTNLEININNNDGSGSYESYNTDKPDDNTYTVSPTHGTTLNTVGDNVITVTLKSDSTKTTTFTVTVNAGTPTGKKATFTVMTDASTPASVSGVQIQVGSSTETTNASGEATLNNVPAGSVTVTLSNLGGTNQLKNIVVKQGGTNIDVTETIAGSEYSFTMPASDVTVEVTVGEPDKKLKINNDNDEYAITLLNGTIAKDGNGNAIVGLTWSYFKNTLTMDGFTCSYLGHPQPGWFAFDIEVKGDSSITRNNGYRPTINFGDKVIIKGDKVLNIINENEGVGVSFFNSGQSLTIQEHVTVNVKTFKGQYGIYTYAGKVIVKDAAMLNIDVAHSQTDQLAAAINGNLEASGNATVTLKVEQKKTGIATGLPEGAKLTAKDNAKVSIIVKQTSNIRGGYALYSEIYDTPFDVKNSASVDITLEQTGTNDSSGLQLLAKNISIRDDGAYAYKLVSKLKSGNTGLTKDSPIELTFYVNDAVGETLKVGNIRSSSNAIEGNRGTIYNSESYSGTAVSSDSLVFTGLNTSKTYYVKAKVNSNLDEDHLFRYYKITFIKENPTP